MKLKNRLSIVVTVVSASALLASFFIVYVLVQRDEMRDLDMALLGQAHTVAQLAATKTPEDIATLEGTALVPESLRPLQRFVAIYAADGKLLVATKNFGIEVPTTEDLGTSNILPPNGVPVNLIVANKALRGVIVPTGQNGGSLLFAASRNPVDEDQQFLLRTLVGLFMAVTLATGFVSRAIGARLARDVQAIARVAREVERGNLEARVGPEARGSAETLALARDLDYMIEKLGALVMAQRTFISHAAHELRSPLTTLRGELQLALRRPRDAEAFRRTIEEVLVDVEALIGLSENLLTLARIQEPQKPGSQVSTVGDIVGDALRAARGLAELKKIVFDEKSENAAANHLTIRGERGEIVRALRNLVDNAVAHSPNEAPVTIAVTSRADLVEIAVADRGNGVSKEDEPYIFQAFYRGTKEQGDDRPGAGLGLAIARGIAKNLGGDIRLDHEWQRGAQFVLVLPVVDPNSSVVE